MRHHAHRLFIICLLLCWGGCLHVPTGATVGFRPMRVIETVKPQFPLEMSNRGITEGQVWLTISVDPDGRLVDRLLTAYTRASFAKAAIEALHEWKFEPARVAGVPVATRQEFHFYFSITGQVVSRSGADAHTSPAFLLPQKPEITVLVVKEEELDAPLQLDKHVAPDWPPQAPAAVQTGRVTLDYFVDGFGRTRLIAVAKSDGDAFSDAATVAVMQWRYAAPLRRGEATSVRKREEIVFQRPPG